MKDIWFIFYIMLVLSRHLKKNMPNIPDHLKASKGSCFILFTQRYTRCLEGADPSLPLQSHFLIQTS